MSTPSGRPNGLPPAASYVALVDVDPPVADHVLALLHDAGIAAVAEPLVGEVGPYRDVRRPDRPTERVHVDRDRRDGARELLSAALPGLRADFHADAAHRVDAAETAAGAPPAEATRPGELDDDDVDAAFAAIVSSYGPVPPAPPVEPPAPSGLSARLVRRDRPEEAHEEPDPPYWPEEHFVPPSPPRGPRLSRASRLAWIGAVGGPLLVLLVVLADLPFRQLGILVGIGAFVAGFATLVARMPDERADDGDDGAVV